MWNVQETENRGCYVLTHFVLNELYQKYQFEAHIFYTKDCDEANLWIRKNLLLQHDTHIVGFDTESKVIRKKGQPTHICLIQLAITPPGDHENPKVLLFHCRQDTQLPQELIWVMESSHFWKCGVGLKGSNGDCAGMLRDFGVNMNGIVELFDHTRVGLKKSVSQSFRNVQVPSYKSICTSNWLVLHLNGKQMMYASLDAIYGERLAVKIISEGGIIKPVDNAEDMIARDKLERLKKKREKQKRMRDKQKQRYKENRKKVMEAKLSADSKEFIPSSQQSTSELSDIVIPTLQLEVEKKRPILSRHEQIKSEFKQKIFECVHSN